MDTKVIINELETINGQFYPGQMSSRLFMSTEDVEEKYKIEFHERFHYLQHIFTPYGHLKWGVHRTLTNEILSIWKDMTSTLDRPKKIPIFEYIKDNDILSLSILSAIYMKIIAKKYSEISEGISLSTEDLTRHEIDVENLLPKITVDKQDYTLNGIDIFESFAKYEEAILAYCIDGTSINETINPEKLDPKYYIPLFYFIHKLSAKRLIEFPIACELSMAFSNLPIANDSEKLKNNHPSWRFIKIVDYLAKNEVPYNIYDNDSFWEYTSCILKGCGFEEWDSVWNPAEEYARSCNLSISSEMLDAIAFKKANPWCLSYPMIVPDFFFSNEFNRFYPLFIITDNDVFYNIQNINYDELMLENEIQSLALQIIGEKSKYNIYPNTLQCADSYFGIKSCKYFKDGICDGHVTQTSNLPEIKLDENDNIIEGCMLQIFLDIIGVSLSNIEIGKTNSHYTSKEIIDAINKL